MENKIDDLIDQIRSQEVSLSKKSEEIIVKYFEKALSSNLTDEMVAALKSHTSKEFRKFVDSEAIEQLKSSHLRLSSSARSVGSRGVVSLLIGITAAAGALWVLHEMIDQLGIEDIENISYKAVIFYGVGRVALAIFITFISYFFLSLYRRSLDEMKYYQSEITNIDSWISATMAAQQSGNMEVLTYCIARLMEIDRATFESDGSRRHEQLRKERFIRISSDILNNIIEKIPR